MPRGTVKWFDSDKGFGFIVPADESGDVFVHYTGIVGDGHRSLDDGQVVAYDLVEGRKGRQATEVTPVQ